jgi:hypothetical protein
MGGLRGLVAAVVIAGCSTGDNSLLSSTTPTTVAPMTMTAPMDTDTSTGEPTTGGESTTTGGASASGTTADTTTEVPTTSGETTTGDESSSGSSSGGPAVCGDGVPAGAEECDDGDADDTNACLSTCVLATCGDGFVQAGVEACDGGAVVGGSCSPTCTVTCNPGVGDCNADPVDGCETNVQTSNAHCSGCNIPCDGTCTAGVCMKPPTEYGPVHTFVGLKSNHFITQGSCAPAEPDAADYFCKRFYNAQCTAKPGAVPGGIPFPTYPKVHKQGGCTGLGLDIPGTTCDGGACKIGDWSEGTSGLNDIVCVCP